MALLYADGTWIEPIKQESLKNPANEIDNGKRISEDLVCNDFYFFELYDEYWLKPCMDYIVSKKLTMPEKEEMMKQLLGDDSLEEEMKQLLDGRLKEEIRKLFSNEAEETKCQKFMEWYCNGMTRPAGGFVCHKALAEGIKTTIKKDMNAMPAYMQLRVLAVCVLLNGIPENIFASGANWINEIDSAINQGEYEKEYVDIEDGMEFTLDLCVKTEKLFSKTLRNTSETSCQFHVCYEGDVYHIYMPPYGILRAVFADAECKKLISIKGNISFADTTSAVIQQGEKDAVKMRMYYRQHRIVDLPDAGAFLDASPYFGGIVILTAQELYSTMGLSIKEDLPIRCYTAGEQWAWLYADGRLKSNLYDVETMQNVTAVIEDGERGLLVCNDEGCWDFRNIAKKEVEQRAFVFLMLDRFLGERHNDACECVSTQFLQLSINRNGGLEDVRL